MNSLSRRDFLRTAALGGAALQLGGLGRADQATPSRRPNLVFMLSDQHAWDMMGCAGNRQIVTPNMDALAAEGIRFTHCFATTPVCTAYRGILLSGMHPFRNGAFINDMTMIPGKGKYFGEVLRDSGYRTAYIGKWHLLGGNRVRPIPPGELRYGFDDVFLSNNCTTVFDAGKAYYWNERGEKTTYPEWEPYGQSRQACDFLDKQKADQPFALFLAWHPPHDHGKEGQYFRYDTEPDLEALYKDCEPELRPATAQFDKSARRKKQYRDYMAQTSGIDRALGMVRNKLRERGLDKNTIIVYTTDHGDVLGAYGWQLSAKDLPHDCDARVPFLLSWPGVLPARASELLLGTFDLMPTLLGLMGLEIPATCQGVNLAQAIKQGDDKAVDSLPILMIHNGPEEWRGVVTRDWSFAAQAETKAFHPLMNILFDRRADPHQLRNRIADPACAKTRQQLTELAEDWMKRLDDPLIGCQQLFDSGVPWAYPDRGGAINRVSPIEWARRQGLGPTRLRRT